ncbi:MAG: hypothetical protein AB1642_12905 [Pseudomonadota bacterium]
MEHPEQVLTLYDLLLLLRERIHSLHKLRDKFKPNSAQHYWCAYAAKRFELAYEHFLFAAISRMHGHGICSPTTLMGADDQKIYQAFIEIGQQYREAPAVDTLITERLLDLHTSMWAGFEALIKLIIEKNNIPRLIDFSADYKALINSLAHKDGNNWIEFINGFKLIRHSEHCNFRADRSFIVVIPSLGKRLSVGKSSQIDLKNKFNLIALNSDMVSLVVKILCEFETKIRGLDLSYA